jgi:hypothetical protein
MKNSIYLVVSFVCLFSFKLHANCKNIGNELEKIKTQIETNNRDVVIMVQKTSGIMGHWFHILRNFELNQTTIPAGTFTPLFASKAELENKLASISMKNNKIETDLKTLIGKLKNCAK